MEDMEELGEVAVDLSSSFLPLPYPMGGQKGWYLRLFALPFFVKLKWNGISGGTVCVFAGLIAGRSGNVVELWS